METTNKVLRWILTAIVEVFIFVIIFAIAVGSIEQLFPDQSIGDYMVYGFATLSLAWWLADVGGRVVHGLWMDEDKERKQ